MDASHFFADLTKLEGYLRLPAGFLERLIEEDDWSFIIKSHAIVEAALTHLITSTTDPRLAPFFARLPLDGRFSKLEVARALGGLDQPVLALVTRISKLRNDLVHDVRYISIDLASYLGAMAPQDRHSLSKLIAQVVAGSDEDSLSALTDSGLSDEPKLTIALAVSAILARTLFKIEPQEYLRARQKLTESTPQLMLIGILILVLMFASKSGGNSVAA